ncbi:phosphatidylglycerophosphate synthase [Kitasatospora gansuensis]|uniref:Phosphatidylglycerophosphate synthase n=1 Tax=Kitasatospora gansuensis TaxID=258050 RepID=A0A7W7SJF1_9ACTN|nr:CDP-alcohol phosphatidyltransferase family protein [Kitasatospora gansuensis]MBB4951580.1 phosphatidylglycerophosphate synthase [Kitasatospora gansuensis]
MTTADRAIRSNEPPGTCENITVAELRELVCKGRDSWWTVLLVDPVALRLVRWTDRHTEVTPDQVTWAALALGLGAAGCFTQGTPGWLLAGALLYHLSFVLDCVDGKLARLQDRRSLFGGWLDFVLDRVRVACCALALMGGQWLLGGDPGYLVLAALVVFLDMFRYLNGLKVAQIRAVMRKQITEYEAAQQGDSPLPVVELTERQLPSVEAVDVHQGFRHRFPWYAEYRTRLVDLRIRPHLVGGIEFQMAVFIVGPVLGQIVGVTLVTGAALVAFELALIYKLLLSTRDFDLTVGRLVPAGAVLPAPAGAPVTESGGWRTPVPE